MHTQVVAAARGCSYCGRCAAGVLPEWVEAMENGAPTNLVVRRALFLLAEGYPVEPAWRRDHEDVLLTHALDLILNILPAYGEELPEPGRQVDAGEGKGLHEVVGEAGALAAGGGGFRRRFGMARINAATVDYVRRPGNHLDRQIKSGKFLQPMSRQHEFDEWHATPERATAVAAAVEAQAMYLRLKVRALLAHERKRGSPLL